MKGGIANLMKQAQAMQEKMQAAQDELAKLEITGSAGGGMVEVTMNGRHDVRRVRLGENLPLDDREVIEDLVAAAVNDAVRKVEKITQEKMQGLGAGMGLPAGLKLPF
ncbi:MAG: YbaB/EbfC family nucleoid-associated protein [Gammaproteobacteria bacterium]|nr:YbaB/EbfC family nucleoid-associated protein [Gammaproteobacteria bacterium]